MRKPSTRRLALPAFVVIAAAAGGFIIARALQEPASHGASVLATSVARGATGTLLLTPVPVATQPAGLGTPVIGPSPLPPNPDTRRGGWALPYLEVDRTKPRNDITVNGIPVGPSVKPSTTVACQPGSPREEPLDQVTQAAAGPVFVAPKYLPPGTGRPGGTATLCTNQAGQTIVIGTYATYAVAPDLAHGRRGGPFEIYRGFSTPAVQIAIPDERWTAGIIAGHPAAIARPILANGLGESAIIIVGDGGVLTKLQASGLTLDELRHIAVGLY